MGSSQLAIVTGAFSAAGAALRAAQAKPRDGYEIADGRVLVITEPMLAAKTLGMIEAGAKLPDEITLPFGESAKMFRFLLTVVTHMDHRYPLIADHPLLRVKGDGDAGTPA